MTTKPTSLIVAICGALLLFCTAWAIMAGDLFSDLGNVLRFPWGRQVLVDLYVGFTLSAVFIWHFEQNKLAAVCWIVPIYFLGNIVTFVWALNWLKRRPAE